MRDLEHIRLDFHLTSEISERFWAKVDKSGGPGTCWPWTASCRGNGYGRFRLDCNTTVGANRMAYALYHRRDPGQMFVCHSCDNPKCCNPAHLWLGTNDDNMADKLRKGRGKSPEAKGEKNGNAKLTEGQVEMVRDLIRRGRNNKEIARVFGVTHQLISRIRRGKVWGVTEPLTPRYASIRR